MCAHVALSFYTCKGKKFKNPLNFYRNKSDLNRVWELRVELNSANTRKKNVHSNGRGCRARFSSDRSSLVHLAFVIVPKSYPEKVLSQADIKPSQREIQLNSFRLYLKHKLAVASGRE